MTKKDYELIAEGLRTSPELNKQPGTRIDLAVHMARLLKEDNPRFDVSRFVRASVGDGEISAVYWAEIVKIGMPK